MCLEIIGPVDVKRNFFDEKKEKLFFSSNEKHETNFT